MKALTMNFPLPLPLWWRAGVGADGLRLTAALPAPLAPIPTFPRKGKEQDR